jgi:hypothetical protein
VTKNPTLGMSEIMGLETLFAQKLKAGAGFRRQGSPQGIARKYHDLR